MTNENCEELSLYKLWIAVCSRIPLIIVCGLIGFIVTFGLIRIVPEKKPVKASVRVNRMEGLKTNTVQEIEYFLSSDNLLAQYVDEKHDIGRLKKSIDISINESTNFIDFYVSKSEEPEFWIGVIEGIVNTVNEDLTAKYSEKAKNTLEHLDYELERIANSIASQPDQVDYNNLVGIRSSIVFEISNFKSALEFVTAPAAVMKLSSSNSKLYVLGVFIACFLGCVYSLLKGLTDKRILLASDISHVVKNGKLIMSIPEHKDKNNIDMHYIEYLDSLIAEKDESVFVTAITEGAGVTTISGKLKYLSSSNIKIVEGDSLKSSPSNLNKAKDSDRVIVVLRRDVDTVSDVAIIDKALYDAGCKNISYILNFAMKNDSSCLKYKSNKEYVGIRYRFW